MKKLAITLLMLLPLGLAYGQQDAQFTQYMFNTNAVNPAYSGSRDALSIIALHRSQWVGFDGAPITQTFNINSPLKNPKLATGLNFVHDKIGPLSQTGLYGDFAYRINMAKAKLSFGLKAGGDIFQAGLSSLKVINTMDANFTQNVTSTFLPNFGFGVYYHAPHFYVGLSTPRLLRNDVEIETGSSSMAQLSVQEMHHFLIAGYVFEINPFIHFKPTAQVKLTNGAPISVDVNASMLFYQKLWLGVGYRQSDAIAALLQFQLTDAFRAGYSYDYTISSMRGYNGGTHEIMIGYDFSFNKTKLRSPRYF